MKMYAWITGTSELNIALTHNLPIPGQANMFSTTTVPAINRGTDMPNAVKEDWIEFVKIFHVIVLCFKPRTLA
ncbi:hypothetical protein D1872_255040 [compost metagenome]